RPVLLLMSPATYRAGAFMAAADALGIDAISIVDTPDALRSPRTGRYAVSFGDLRQATDEIVAIAREVRASAVLAVDDSATELAALVNAALGLPHNRPESATAARDKLVMRSLMHAGGARTPAFRAVPAQLDPHSVADSLLYPSVVKPLRLSGSRGVIRVDDPPSFVAAFQRVVAILESEGVEPATAMVLIEEYLPGDEVALEGLLTAGELTVLALFDKPDPLVGPFFEETIYITPSRLPDATQAEIVEATRVAALALGLREGPIHAELRVNQQGAWLIEVAGRSIGGLCSTILTFGAGMSLEEMILRHATGMEIGTTERSGGAVGVMMIPIPRSGIFRGVTGISEAAAVEGITGIEITARVNYPIQALPEGASYLGFIFARGDTPGSVEQALRDSHARLRIRIDALAPIAGARPVPLIARR
ncbi:MAG: phosphoribosylglycinamide synthetase, partial [Chloroflexi bacterium]